MASTTLPETWVCIDEDRNETIHTSVPRYNQLHRRWKSDFYIHVNSGMINLIVPTNQLLINVAAAYNINPKGDNKILNIFKGKL